MSPHSASACRRPCAQPEGRCQGAELVNVYRAITGARKCEVPAHLEGFQLGGGIFLEELLQEAEPGAIQATCDYTACPAASALM